MPGENDPRFINAVSGGIVDNPMKSAAGISDCGWRKCNPCSPVTDSNDYEAPGQVGRQMIGHGLPTAAPPSAAVEVDQCRTRPCRHREMDVELAPPVSDVSVDQIQRCPVVRHRRCRGREGGEDDCQHRSCVGERAATAKRRGCRSGLRPLIQWDGGNP